MLKFEEETIVRHYIYDGDTYLGYLQVQKYFVQEDDIPTYNIILKDTPEQFTDAQRDAILSKLRELQNAKI